jgi:hypothetical protein
MPTKTTIAQTISVDDFKQSAKRLTDILKQKEIPIKHSEALELMSNINGFKDYNTFVAFAKENNKQYDEQYDKLLTMVKEKEKTIEKISNFADMLHSFSGKKAILEHIEETIEGLEFILYFYEDNKGNYVKFRRASDIVDFHKSERKEDFIIAELCNNFIVQEKAKMHLLDDNYSLLGVQDILKNVFSVFKDLKIKTYNSEAISIKLNGKLLKNFEYNEVAAIYEDKNITFTYTRVGSDFGPRKELVIKIGKDVIYDDSKDFNNSASIAQDLINGFNLSKCKAYIEYVDALNRLKTGNGFIVKLEDEQLYYPGIGTIEERINDEIIEISRTFIINAIEFLFNKVGLFEALKKELNKAQLYPDLDIFSSCSQDIIKMILKTGNPKAKEFSFEINTEIYNTYRVDEV